MQASPKKAPVAAEKNVLSQLGFKYLPYWPLFVLFVVASLAGAWVYIRYKTTPLYESVATILIKDEKKGQDDSKMIESLNMLSSKKIIENEMEVLQSKELMLQVVKKLHLYAQIFEKGKVKPLSIYTTSPVRIQMRNPESLEPVSNVFFTYDSLKKVVLINKQPYPIDSFVKTPYGELRFVLNRPWDFHKNPIYFSLVSPKRVSVSLANSLNISSASKMSSVLKLKIRDEEPERGEDILNELLASYRDAEINDKRILAMNTLNFVDERLNAVAHDLDSIEGKLQQYKSRRGAIDIGSQGTMFLQNVTTLDNRMGDVNTQLSVLDKVEDYVKSKDQSNSGGIVPSTVGVSDPLLSQLLTKLYESEIQSSKLKKTYGNNNPAVITVNDEIEKIKPSILENIRSQRQSLESSKQSLSQINNKYSSMLGSIPQKEKDLVEISREQNVKTGIYNFLLQKREETALSLSSYITDTRTIDKAQSSIGPVSPDKKKIYAIALLIAVALVVALVTLNEMFKRTILYRHEIEGFTSVPVIGEVVYEKSGEQIVIGNGKRTFIAEQFRNLRTSLHYIGLNADRKKLLITSTVSGEGKSFIVANLGVSLAMAGKKVVVLEFDLSDPTLSQKLGFTATKGITDYLNGTAEPEEIVRRTAVHENLFIMPAGPLPENPSEMIMSDKVPELLNYLTGIFDYIIVDSAPVGLLSDGYVLSGYCDATLYVVRHRHTRKISIQRLDENNKVNELKNVAIVFNGVRARGFGNNGYGYGYGYGYIYDEGKKKKKREQSKTVNS